MLADATGDFNRSCQLKKFSRGTSSAGTMFWGTLISDEGLETPVAIKKFHHRFTDDMIMKICEDLKGQVLRHRNLLCPLGYSLRKGKLYVVYEFMTMRSLDQHLFHMKCNPNQELSWERRCRIIIGIAMGLHHLHCNKAIHGAVKVSNILLDQDMTARLGDFGVWAHHQDGNILGAADAKLAAAGDFKEAEAHKLLLVGLACSHPEPKDRPGMGDVVEMLTGRAPLPFVPSQKPTCEAALCG
ncbi:hypothetical protein BAE44_0016342 [Dichanthelium oligosanthes]|uniref:Protein kinase domain-containing protein n=1 Tax=Dichanthelium oligosanthes TaxID=888268 RepID=A0A1E5VBW5_9POAL|nr:hypothetical protein BAE44_0016342 [Dichanthelium oligosanthes]